MGIVGVKYKESEWGLIKSKIWQLRNNPTNERNMGIANLNEGKQ